MFFETADEFAAWLEKHGADRSEVIVGYGKLLVQSIPVGEKAGAASSPVRQWKALKRRSSPRSAIQT